MKSKKDYLFAIQTKDHFKALAIDNKVNAWCMQTGSLMRDKTHDFNISEKIRCPEKLPNSEFEVYTSNGLRRA